MDKPSPNQHFSSLKELKVEVEQVNYFNEDNGWSVLKVTSYEEKRTVNAVGYFPRLFGGEHFILYGQWTSHKSFGKQFKVERAISSQPQSRAGICRYLSSGLFKGVGEKTAQKIVGHFGVATIKILDESPEKLNQVPKLGKSLAKKIIESWNSQKATNETLMFLYNHGMMGAKAQKLIKLYGSQLISQLTQNPFRLIKDVRGIGFLTADRIAQSMGIALDHPQRIQEGVLYVLSDGEESGHCYLTTSQLESKLASVLGVDRTDVGKSLFPNLKVIQDELRVVSVPSEGLQKKPAYFHYLADLYQCEQSVWKTVRHLLATSFAGADPKGKATQLRVANWIEQYCEKTSTQLSASQREAVTQAVSNKFFILTGGPGVGKTTTANTIIRLFKAMGKQVALAAPTGRAAQRLSEISGEVAKTIHRLLEWSAMDFSFKKNEDNKLTVGVVIIDEASMLDVRLASKLLEAINSSCQVVFIGDVDQLPPVGAGNVLRDLIDSNAVPYKRLEEVFRQASASHIIQVAHAINKGSLPRFSHDHSSDCRFIEINKPEKIVSFLRDLLTKHLPDAGYDPVKDVQILSPMNKGELGSVHLNQQIQEWVNPKHEQKEWSKTKTQKLREKDKVIQHANNYELGVFNGDIGFVELADVDGGKMFVQFGGRTITYESEHTDDLSLAYAITVHKSQGSEFPVVIIPLSMAHYVMLQKNLVYTALTRAKKLAIFVGEIKALGHALGQETSSLRQTRLANLLSE